MQVELSKLASGFIWGVLIMFNFSIICHYKGESLLVCNYNKKRDVVVLVRDMRIYSNEIVWNPNRKWLPHIIKDGKCKYLKDRYRECNPTWWEYVNTYYEGGRYYLVILVLDTSYIAGTISDSALMKIKHLITDTIIINYDSIKAKFPNCKMIL